MNSHDLLDNTNTQALPGEKEGRMSRVNLFYTGGGGSLQAAYLHPALYAWWKESKRQRD